jgi:hypothetical protein
MFQKSKHINRTAAKAQKLAYYHSVLQFVNGLWLQGKTQVSTTCSRISLLLLLIIIIIIIITRIFYWKD